MIKLREYCDTDKNIVETYLSDSLLKRYTNKLFPYCLFSRDLFYVCVEQEHIIGFCVLRKKMDFQTKSYGVWLFDFMIFPQYRGRGYGKEFLQMISSIVLKKHNWLRLKVSNIIALNLYLTNGFYVEKKQSSYLIMKSDA